MSKYFSLRAKLILAFMAVAILVGGVTLYQIRSINELNSNFNDLIDSDMARLNQLDDMRFQTLDLVQKALADIRDLRDDGKIDASTAQTELQQILQSIKNNQQTYQELIKADDDVDGAKAAAIARAADALVKETLSAIESKAPTTAALEETSATLREGRTELIALLNVAITEEQKQIQQENVEGDATTIRIINTNIILAAVTAVAALLIGLLTAGILGRAVNKVREGAERVANGDFSRPIKVASSDELGQLAGSFNNMAERLRESYNRLALERQRDEILLESMSDGLIAIDTTGKIVLVNSRAAEMLDIHVRGTLIGKKLDEELMVYGKDDKPLPSDYHPAAMALEQGTPITDIFTYHKQDGKKIVISITMSPVTTEGKADGVIMVMRDVTQEMQVDRMKTEFISLASHQLRTPLSAIKWFIEMLLNGDAGKLKPEQQEFAKNVADSTERMIQLVNSLLNISRIESGRIIIDPKPTDVHELISGIVNDLKAKTAERQQNLVVSVHDGLPKVNLDPRLISQVYMNLLTNAIKYTPKGGEISVFVSRKGDELVSQVTDNGFGIPKAEQSKMFQKFFRAANVAKVETDGTGLGLYLIKAIVESSGGKIWFESEEARGSMFWFSLPMSGMKAREGEVTLDA